MLRFVLVVVLFAALTYAVVWAILRRRGGGGSAGLGSGPRGRRTPPTRHVAPDDDEDFLRWLDRKKRSTGQDHPTDGPPSPDPEDGRAPESD